MKKPKILFVGESWTVVTTHIKGADQFTLSFYEEGVKWIKDALESKDVDFNHMPCHIAMLSFPATAEELAQYDCVVFSDVGYNSITLHPDTTSKSLQTPNRLIAIEQYVKNGGAFLMIGGYMSFSGIEAKAHYQGSLIEEILPVNIMCGDDRVEIPQGINPAIVSEHPVLAGIDEGFPHFLSYNKLIPKKEAKVVLKLENDPLLTVWEYGKGRTAAFAADCAPHGAPPVFLNWKYFSLFWSNLINWLSGK